MLTMRFIVSFALLPLRVGSGGETRSSHYAFRWISYKSVHEARVFREATVAHLVSKLFACMKHEVSFTFSYGSPTGTYPKQVESSQHSHIYTDIYACLYFKIWSTPFQ
jgi:hypothetical protein